MQPIDAQINTTLMTHPHASAIVAAIEDAGIAIEFGNAGYAASDPAAAQAIIEGTSWLDQAKAIKANDLGLFFLGKIAAGFAYTGADSVQRVFQIDPQSQFNIDARSNAALGSILNGEPWDPNTFFIAADNSLMPTPTAASMRTFSLAVHAYVTGLIIRNRILKDQIIAAQTIADLDAIDLTVGWP